MNCCVGDVRINFGKWYCPNDTTPDKFTYCEYCYNNGCVEKDKVYEVEKPINCNCDCPKKDSHIRMVGYFCPVCNLINFANRDCMGYMLLLACYECKQINCSSFEKYCDGCSYHKRVCVRCGDAVTDGNTYISNMEKFAASNIASLKEKNDDMSKMIIEELGVMMENAKKEYTDKTAEEMATIILDKIRTTTY